MDTSIARLFSQAATAQLTFLRPLLGAVAYTGVVLLWNKRLKGTAAAALALLISAFVLGRTWPAFFAVNALVYVVVRLSSSSRRKAWMVCTLVALAGAFVVAQPLAWDRNKLEVAGTSWAAYYLDMWMLLRLVTFIWEVDGGLVQVPSVSQYAAWAANPLLLGGPLIRFSQWPRGIAGDRRGFLSAVESAGLSGLAMILIGLAISAMALEAASVLGADAKVLKLASVLFVGPWVFYLTIGGFFRLVECLGSACGVKVPRSFYFPFFRSNIAEFWSRWNLTATSVFRDYFFYNRWGLRGHNAYVNTMIVFVFMGLWHGSNAYWICFGALHGLFFCAYLWSRPRLRRFAGQRWFETGSIALTYLAVCSAWYIPNKVAMFFR